MGGHIGHGEHARGYCRAVEGTRVARDRADVRGHDLRRTAASLMASGSVPCFLISRILNHSQERNITSVYERYNYDAEKFAAME
jgi:integrase